MHTDKRVSLQELSVLTLRFKCGNNQRAAEGNSALTVVQKFPNQQTQFDLLAMLWKHGRFPQSQSEPFFLFLFIYMSSGVL